MHGEVEKEQQVTYEVEKVIRHTCKKGEYSYVVKWVGRSHTRQEPRYTRAQIFKWRLGGVQLKNKVLHPIRGRDPQRPGPSGDAHRLPRPGSGHLHISRHRAP